MRYLSTKNLPILVALILLFVPLFWFPYGELNLGGDSSRLYFYDPIAYLKNFNLYYLGAEGIGFAEPNFYFIPHLLFIALIKKIVISEFLVIGFFNGLKLSLAFYGVFLITKELILSKKTNSHITLLASTLAGLFYIFLPMNTANWNSALMSHNQIFLNPLMFYLLLKLMTTRNMLYTVGFLLTSFVFSPNFALTSAPAVFSFYPLALLFLFLYILIILKKTIPWKLVFATFALFLGLHAFHLIPQIVSLIDPGSFANQRVFDKASIANEGVRYFTALLPLAKVSQTILVPPLGGFSLLMFTAPIIILLGFLFRPKKNSLFLLTGIFFLIGLFLLSANITSFGVEFYRRLFYLPGFSMFRNFIGQWTFIYSFFYALIFGQALYFLFMKLPKKATIPLFATISLVIIFQALAFITGKLVHMNLRDTYIKNSIIFDQEYIQTLDYIEKLPDGKILTLPFTDSYYQVIVGKNGGGYLGPSTISYLAGKKDFSGYQIMTPRFSEIFLSSVKKKDYPAVKNLLAELNIRYIFHNEDPRVYDSTFSEFPYSYVRESLPKTQREYKEFIKKLGVKERYRNGTYVLYEMENYVPIVYVFQAKDNTPKVHFQKINPIKYTVTISSASGSFTLALQEAFHPQWRVYLLNQEGKSEVNAPHTKINDYANGWQINPKDLGAQNFRLSIEMRNQKYFYVGLVVSGISIILLILLSVKTFRNKVTV